VAGDDESIDDEWDEDWDPEWEPGPGEGHDRELVQRIMAREASPPQWFLPAAAGTFDVRVPAYGRALVARVATDLRDLLLAGDPSLQRLYPTAYPQDPDRNEEFTAFAHDQLLMARLEALDLVEATIERDELTQAELNAWMQVVNEARLVLGTRLDVTEDDDRDEDPDDPDAPAFVVYHHLGLLVHDIVRALHAALPPPEADADD
jgi:hypothetical protein